MSKFEVVGGGSVPAAQPPPPSGERTPSARRVQGKTKAGHCKKKKIEAEFWASPGRLSVEVQLNGSREASGNPRLEGTV
jgi:hypothetical protein